MPDENYRTKEQILNGMDEYEFFARGYKDFQFFTENVFDMQLENLQVSLVNEIETYNRVAVIAFTGFGKTEILGVLYPLWKMYYNRLWRMLVVTPSIEASTKLIRRIKDKMDDNEIIHELIPKVKDKWSETELITSNKCHVFCKPLTPNVAGVHVNYLLPDEVSKYRDADLFKSEVLTRTTALENTKIAAISTPEKEGDLIHQLHDNSEFKGLTYTAYDKDGNPTCPNRFPREKLEQIERMIGKYAFGRQYNCDCTSVGDRCFIDDINKIVGCFDKNVEFTEKCTPNTMRFIGADFASSPKGDYSVFTVIELVNKKAVIKEIIRLRGEPTESQEDMLVSLNETYQPSSIIVDGTNIGSIMMNNLINKGLPIMEQRFSNVERNDLFKNLRRMFDNNQLVIPRGPESEAVTDILFNEISSVVEEQTPSGMQTFTAKTAHDDCCFVAGTRITTPKGYTPIEKLKVGDLVLTRKGYRKIIKTFNRSTSVIDRFGLTGTKTHPIITTKGIVNLNNLKVTDNTYIWNPKLSCIEERTISDIRNLKDGNSEFISGIMEHGKNHQLHCIGRYGLTHLEKLNRGLLSTTKTEILSTTISRILNFLKKGRICHFMHQHQKENCKQVKTSRRTSLNMPKYYEMDGGKAKNYVNTEEETQSILQMHQNMSMFAKYVERNFLVQGLKRFIGVLKNVVQKHGHCQENVKKQVQDTDLRRVYNLTVEDCHEYFANSILVHNCMSLGMACKFVTLNILESEEVEPEDKKENKILTQKDMWIC